jgi:hypothetical protein
MRRPFHLQPVWAIISELRDVEVLIKVAVELGSLHLRLSAILPEYDFSRTSGHPIPIV